MESRTIQRRQMLRTLTLGGLACALLICTDSAQAAERHPHIHSAIRALKDARTELKERDKVFGGHGEKAVKAVDDAIEQLQRALDFADKN